MHQCEEGCFHKMDQQRRLFWNDHSRVTEKRKVPSYERNFGRSRLLDVACRQSLSVTWAVVGVVVVAVVRSPVGAYEEHAVNKKPLVHIHNQILMDRSLVILNRLRVASRNDRYAQAKMATYSSGKPRRGENNLVNELVRIQLTEAFTHFHIAP
jgi:hypothetical protein